MAGVAFIEQLRTELPKLLREHPEVRHEVWGIVLEAFPSRQEFMALVEEMRAAREESNRRFEEMRQDMNSRFEAVDRRFEAVITELRRHGEELQSLRREVREVRVGMSSLGDRVGRGLEGVLREVIEEFAGETFPFVERLVLRDETGEVYGVTGADVEFDLYVHNEHTACLVEAKSYLKPDDVLMFHRKVRFAEEKLGRAVTPPHSRSQRRSAGGGTGASVGDQMPAGSSIGNGGRAVTQPKRSDIFQEFVAQSLILYFIPRLSYLFPGLPAAGKNRLYQFLRNVLGHRRIRVGKDRLP